MSFISLGGVPSCRERMHSGMAFTSDEHDDSIPKHHGISLGTVKKGTAMVSRGDSGKGSAEKSLSAKL